MKTRFRRRIPDSQLHRLVRRLLRSNQPDIDTPVIISPMEGKYYSSVGRLLERIMAGFGPGRSGGGAGASGHSFLPENAYVAEVVKCQAKGKQFAVDLVLIQYQNV